MKIFTRVTVAAFLFVFSLSASAGVLKTWDLTNKSPGALGADYGLRLNQTNTVGAGGGASNTLIFDFEAAGHGVQLQLVDNAGDLEMHLSGTAFGALYNGAGGYDTQYAGSYDIDFIWKDVEENTNGFAYIAENEIGNFQIGDGVGSVTGTTAGTAWMSGLDIFDYSGAYDWTLDIKDPSANNNPDASGWLTYAGDHNGDFGFSMENETVPAPGGLVVIGFGLMILGAMRKSRA